MKYEDYLNKVNNLFIENCLKDISKDEKEKYLKDEDTLDTIKNRYEDDLYLFENMEGYEKVFDDYSILSRTCRTLEKLY